ncbi:transcriptional repressor [Acutalibacter sp. 1XD8-33]|uniref:Fur family transcriptional regulator n=1 Tax=Acutalibacter sp. 1XD8-33 TaxID=2320081 RepID=UPI000EA01D27|nr:transcriptional repressor [Acutalibacter sp. 1XD8-33]RKJ39848.1 transcriptional repressor [Acutalibacter sp. 1XD8-33]
MPPKRENFSRKRAAILAALRETKTHPTAEWIFRQLKPQYPDLSLGTVYRNLNRFRENGLVLSVGVVDGYERFDGNTAPHAHLICKNCGAVLDLPAQVPELKGLRQASQGIGCRIDSASVTLRGLCPCCVKKEETDGAS